MNRKQFLANTIKGTLAGLLLPHLPASLRADTPPATDEKAAAPLSRSDLIAAAREILAAQQFCAFITQHQDGRSQVRTVNPFPPEDDMAVWFATSTLTRKVQHIRHDPRVALYYADHAKATGYVSITGRALLVEDRAEMIKRKRAYWDTAFPGFKNLVLVKVVPEHMEVVNYNRGANGDPVKWQPPSVDFKP